MATTTRNQILPVKNMYNPTSDLKVLLRETPVPGGLLLDRLNKQRFIDLPVTEPYWPQESLDHKEEAKKKFLVQKDVCRKLENQTYAREHQELRVLQFDKKKHAMKKARRQQIRPTKQAGVPGEEEFQDAREEINHYERPCEESTNVVAKFLASTAAKAANLAFPRVNEAVEAIEDAADITADTMDEVSGLAGQMKELSAHLSGNTVPKFDKVIGDINEMVKNVKPQLHSFGAANAVLNTIKSEDLTDKLLNVLVSAYSLWRSFQSGIIEKSIAVYQMLVALGVKISHVGSLMELIQNYFNPAQEVRKQAGLESRRRQGEKVLECAAFLEEYVTPTTMLATMGAIVGAIILGKTPAGPTLDKMVSFISTKTKLFVGAVSALKAIHLMVTQGPKIVEDIVAWWKGELAPDAITRELLEMRNEEVSEWVESVARLNTEQNRLRLSFDNTLQKEALLNKDKAVEFVQTFCTETVTPGVMGGFKEMSKICLEHAKIVETSQLAANVRRVPFVICLGGAPGVGKSLLTNLIVTHLANISKQPKENRSYARNPTLKHWDGYTGQFATVFDDFFQNTDSEDVNEFILCHSNAQYRLPMASIEEKGRCFSSDLIVLTTNTMYPTSNKIRTRNALWRRRDLLVKVKVPADFDYRTVEIGEVSHLKFDFLDPVTENVQPLRSGLTFDDFFYQIGMRFTDHLERADKTRLFLENYAVPQSSIDEAYFSDPDEGDLEAPADWNNDINYAHDRDFFLDGEENDEWDCSVTHLRKPSEWSEFWASTPRGKYAEFLRWAGVLLCHSVRQSCPDRHIMYVKNSKYLTNRYEGGTWCSGAASEWMRPQLDYLVSFLIMRAWEVCPDTMCVSDILEILREDWVYLPLVVPACVDVAQVQRGEFWPGNPWRINLEVCQYVVHNWQIPPELVADAQLYDTLPPEQQEYLLRLSFKSEEDGKKEKVGNSLMIALREWKNALAATTASYWNSFCDNHPWVVENLSLLKMAAGIAGVVVGGLTLFRFFGSESEAECTPGPSALWDSDLDAKAESTTPSGDETSRRLRNRLVGSQVPGNFAKLEAAIPSGDEKTRRMKSKVVVAQSAHMDKVRKNIIAFQNKPVKITPITQNADLNAHQLMVHRLSPATYVLLRNESPAYPQGSMVHCFMVKGSIMLTVFHIFEDVEEGEDFQILQNGVWTTYSFSFSRMTRLGDKDAVLYDLGRRMRPHADSTHLFIQENELARNNVFDCGLLTKADGLSLISCGKARACEELLYGDEFSSFYLRDGWRYTATTKSGDCGSVLVAYNKYLTHKLCGIHVAGFDNKNIGYSELITGELLREHLDRLEAQTVGLPIPQAGITDADLAKAHVCVDGDCSIVGVLPKGQMIVQPCTTDIIPSMIHDEVYPHLTEPAVLTPRDPRLTVKLSPLEKGINKYGEETKPFYRMDIDAISDHLLAQFRSLPLVGPRRILTDDEAINGVEGCEFFDRMNMSTSAGYPYVLRKPAQTTGKVWLFKLQNETQETFEVNDEQLLLNYVERERAARNGERVLSIWTDCLKDERRSLEKVAAGKTRTFTIAPTDYTMLCRKYFLSFAAFYYQNRLKTHSAVGINCEGPEWTTLWNKLREVGNKGFAGDYSCFDGKLDPDIMDAACDLINEWYNDGPEAARVRKVLVNEMVHTVQLANNLVYIKHRGNPSGNPLTVILNTLVGAYYLRLAWRESCHKMGEVDLAHMRCYDKYVRDSIYGDDNIVAVHPEVQELFNAGIVHDILAAHHIEYTNADKGSTIVPLQPLEELTFLKRGFRTHHTRQYIKLAPISLTTIQELTNWIRRCEDPEAALQENVETAIRFAYHHGKEFFDKFIQDVNRALINQDLPACGDSYRDYDLAFVANF